MVAATTIDQAFSIHMGYSAAKPAFTTSRSIFILIHVSLKDRWRLYKIERYCIRSRSTKAYVFFLKKLSVFFSG